MHMEAGDYNPIVGNRGDLVKRKRQGLESNQRPPTIYTGALNH